MRCGYLIRGFSRAMSIPRHWIELVNEILEYQVVNEYLSSKAFIIHIKDPTYVVNIVIKQ